MKFSGRLQIEADPRNWVKTDLNLSQGRLELVSGGDVLGSWSTAQVKAERVEGDKFQLHLGEDRLIFAADDALAFSYEALPVLAKKSVLAVAGGLRVKLRKGLAAPERTVHADVPIYVEPAAAPPAVDSIVEGEPVEEVMPTRKLRDLIQAAVKNNAAGFPSPGAGDRPGPATRPSEPVAPPQGFEADRPTSHPGPPISEGPSDPEAAIPGPDDEVVGESIVEGSVADLSQIPAATQPDEPAFDLSPRFAASARPHLPSVEAGASGSLSETGARFERGETLGDRQPGSFRWTPNADEADADEADAEEADADEAYADDANANETEPPTIPEALLPPAIKSLDGLVDDVRNAALSPVQIGAVTNLLRALADAIEESDLKV